MKKVLALLLCIMMLLPMCLAGGNFVYAAEADKKVVYIKDGGDGDGSSPDKALGLITPAYQALGDEGGRIVVCGAFTLQADFTEPVHSGEIIISQNYNDIDYRAEGTFTTNSSGRRFILNGPTSFENITFEGKLGTYILFIAQNNKITMGEGIECKNFSFSQIANAVTVLGGRQYGVTPAADHGRDSDITIKSGKFIVVGMNRQMSDAWDGTANITILGGEIKTLYGGSVNAGSAKASKITVNGGKFTGACDAGNTVSGTLELTINGGDFSDCSGIGGGNCSSTVTVAKAVEADVLSKLSSFKNIHTSEGVKHQYIPEEVFGSDSFTAENGAALPYRVYFPQGYDKTADKTYPVFFYFHGLGSRGTDNKLQLGSTHALIPKVLNSGTEFIIVAPQCPKTSQWVMNSNYPGGTGFDPDTTPESPYLIAAIELLNKFIKEEKTDITRIYLGGASNGAAACWSLISRSPNTVAGALIQAGTGSTGAPERVAEACLSTPIWTFHGDKDTTLSVEGTREIAAQLQALGAKHFKYTEMPGYNHNIWSDAANMPGVIEWLLEQKRVDSTGVFTQRISDAPAPTPPESQAPETQATEALSPTTDTENATEGGDFPTVAIIVAAAVTVTVAAVAAVIVTKKKKK